MNINTENETTASLKEYVYENGDKQVNWMELAFSIAVKQQDYAMIKKILKAYNEMDVKPSFTQLYAIHSEDLDTVITVCENMDKNYFPNDVYPTDEIIDYLLTRDSANGFKNIMHASNNRNFCTLEVVKKIVERGGVLTSLYATYVGIYQDYDAVKYMCERGVFPHTTYSTTVKQIVDAARAKQGKPSTEGVPVNASTGDSTEAPPLQTN